MELVKVKVNDLYVAVVNGLIVKIVGTAHDWCSNNENVIVAAILDGTSAKKGDLFTVAVESFDHLFRNTTVEEIAKQSPDLVKSIIDKLKRDAHEFSIYVIETGLTIAETDSAIRLGGSFSNGEDCLRRASEGANRVFQEFLKTHFITNRRSFPPKPPLVSAEDIEHRFVVEVIDGESGFKLKPSDYIRDLIEGKQTIHIPDGYFDEEIPAQIYRLMFID